MPPDDLKQSILAARARIQQILSSGQVPDHQPGGPDGGTLRMIIQELDTMLTRLHIPVEQRGMPQFTHTIIDLWWAKPTPLRNELSEELFRISTIWKPEMKKSGFRKLLDHFRI